MKKLSAQGRTMLCLALMLLSALALFFVKRQTDVQISDDPLSTGIITRWRAALPAGFVKESAEHLTEAGGRNFAKLVYEKDVARHLVKWTAPDADFLARWQALVDEMRADGATTPEEAALLDGAPVPDAAWRCFSLADEAEPRNEILLCYNAATRTMLVAERRVEEEGT